MPIKAITETSPLILSASPHTMMVAADFGRSEDNKQGHAREVSP
jgi:hypothetical protein